ncbi:hypothetical protein ASPWEDRAFT_46529 [Aspergillus wentii DTO 134E9]|uniref:Uncharacterized protein n=1 Tax=Aspergillus wentii DTO 134E9 TaxID=1073089 RepID=A0A1L9R4G6_ASPWE|nr:uncharacterized protein ASPWEDRAFT_46529 [Aspergillus wentii DTO 134E9]KAI9927056.1 hypothetical protein MW887_003437 [Aspergillus wentii]OJJ29773.1 hypothetical protein ASPWEDRAFT_46529 [Aspergillus wentii DTO 134E9]
MAFEDLPTELRILILKSLPDVHALRNLVCASPSYYDTYLLAKRDLLLDLAKRLYGLVDLAEPVAAIRSEGLYANVASNKEKIIALLDRRRRHGELSQSRKDTCAGAPSNIHESIQLLHLYKKLDALLQAYQSHAPCPPWVDQETWKQQLPLQLSETERARILRALCRIQTYYNIVGAREYAETEAEAQSEPGSPCSRKSSTWYKNFTTNEIWNLFFGTMPPWEVEEFGSVWVFIRDQYRDMFAEVAREFPRSDARWKALRPRSLPVEMVSLYPNPEEDDIVDDVHGYNEYCNHLVSLGPCFLQKVRSQPRYQDRRNMLACNAIASKSSFMDLVEVIRDPPPLLYPADKYDSPDIGRLLPTLPAMEQPNPSWKQHWHHDGTLESVVFATRPRVSVDGIQPWTAQNDLERTIGYFDGWDWGYSLLDTERVGNGAHLMA